MAETESLVSDILYSQSVLDGHRLAALAAGDASRTVWANSVNQVILKSAIHSQVLVQTILRPFEDIHRAGLSEADSAGRRNMASPRQMMADFEAQFRLPAVLETARLMAELQSGPFMKALAMGAKETSALQRAMESMRTPWLDVHEKMRSLASFAELQGIGRTLQDMPPFGEDLSAALRLDLGDWRDPITWRPEIFADLGARSEFYAGLGFNRSLTDFPVPAFQERLAIAGLRREPPLLVELYGTPIPRSDDEKEKNFERTNTAYDWLLRLETQLRAFIDEKMTRAFGEDWPKDRLPNGLYEEWKEKKRKAKQFSGKDWPLIAFADFTDYERVICRSDNWREIFSRFFGRQESVRESFQRLHLIRLDTMHARPITQDDELLLYVETRRLVKVIMRNC